jgi:hypothetical protein
MWHEEAFHRLGVHDVESLILVDALFPLDGGRKREGKKKEIKNTHHGGGGFHRGWTCLASCAAVFRC